MSDGPSGVMATEGVSDATGAFQAALDAESPSRSKRSEERTEPQRTGLNDLFPNRKMDRRESEGGADDDPEVVKQARKQARSQDDESDPGDPTEGNDEDEEEIEEEDQPADDEEPEDEEEDDDSIVPQSGEIDPNLIVNVMVDGKPHAVAIGEALNGYIRQETFHQRMGALGQAVQSLNVQRQEFQTMAAKQAEEAQLLSEFITAVLPQEPDWHQLFQANPGEAAHLKFRWDEFQQKIGSVASIRQAAVARQQQIASAELHQFANANRIWLAQQHPEWKNEKTWKRDHDSMRRTARSAGYNDAEIAQLYDARAVTVLLKAAAWDRMQAAKPRPVRQSYAPSKRNGSTPQARNLSRSFERAEKRLSRTGSISAAADVFERILDSEG